MTAASVSLSATGATRYAASGCYDVLAGTRVYAVQTWMIVPPVVSVSGTWDAETDGRELRDYYSQMAAPGQA